jgi:hypothetical protein
MLVGSREKTSAADNLPAQTIVVFNAAVPDAESLANLTNKLGVPARSAMTSSVASWKNAIPS